MPRNKLATCSLRAPFVAEDNNNWEISGAADVKEAYVRLTPTQPSQTGLLASKHKFNGTDWEVLLEFSIGGGLKRGGGEGMAFW
jgi:hypothetical protein